MAERTSKGKAGSRRGKETLALTISPGQRRLFTLLTLLLPLLFFAAVEGGLRLAGYGEDYALFIPFGPDPDYLQVNPGVGRRYFPAAEAPLPGFELLRAHKDPRALRFFVQGASTAVGFPYGHQVAFGRLVRAALRRAANSRPVEVVNTALTAVNSYTLLDLAPEIAARDPDGVLIYAGHNEYYGAFGVGSAISVGRSGRLVRAYLGLRRLRTVQLLRNLLVRVRPTVADGGRSAPMERVVARERIPYGSSLYRAGEEQYRANLHRLLSFYEEREIPVYLATLVSNLRDLPPFIGTPRDPEILPGWEAAVRETRAALATGDTAAAREGLARALAADSMAAEAHYLKGRLLEAEGRPAEALAAYVRAWDLDELRFRAPSGFNDVVRAEAAEHGAVVVDVAGAFAAASPHGLIGDSLLTEHVHPNMRGTRLLAAAFTEAVERGATARGGATGRAATGAAATGTATGAAATGAAPEAAAGTTDDSAPASPCAEVVLTAVDSVVAEYRLASLRAGWPFVPAGTEPPEFQPRNRVEELALELFNGELVWLEAMNELGAYYEERGELERALEVACAMADEMIQSPYPLLAAGRLLTALGRYEEAAGIFQQANAREPTAYGFFMLGVSLLHLGDTAGAETALRRAVILGPSDSRPRRLLDALRALGPDHPELEALLAELQASGSR